MITLIHRRGAALTDINRGCDVASQEGSASPRDGEADGGPPAGGRIILAAKRMAGATRPRRDRPPPPPPRWPDDGSRRDGRAHRREMTDAAPPLDLWQMARRGDAL